MPKVIFITMVWLQQRRQRKAVQGSASWRVPGFSAWSLLLKQSQQGMSQERTRSVTMASNTDELKSRTIKDLQTQDASDTCAYYHRYQIRTVQGWFPKTKTISYLRLDWQEHDSYQWLISEIMGKQLPWPSSSTTEIIKNIARGFVQSTTRLWYFMDAASMDQEVW